MGGGIYETRIKPVFSYIHKNFRKTISISEIAAVAGYSECYFMSMFKKITGYTFVEYLNIIRIENARKLLVESDMSVSEIAWQSGFNNLSYFIRLFKKKFDCSPLKYRNSTKKV